MSSACCVRYSAFFEVLLSRKKIYLHTWFDSLCEGLQRVQDLVYVLTSSVNFMTIYTQLCTLIKLNIFTQSTWRVACTLTGGVTPTPAGLLISRPFWVSLCLLFSNGLFTVPPWSLRTDSARSGVVLFSSWKRYYMSQSHQKGPNRWQKKLN